MTRRCCKMCQKTKTINKFATTRNGDKHVIRHLCINCDKIERKERNHKSYMNRYIKKEDILNRVKEPGQIECECGCYIKKTGIYAHRKTKKHIERIKNLMD